MDNRTLVTGASGHLGLALVRALLDGGRPVRALIHKDEASLTGLDIERVRGDVLDANAVHKAAEGCAVVHHLAAVVKLQPWDHGDMEAVNVDGVRNVIDAVKATGARLVHYSSIHAYHPDQSDDEVNESRRYATDPAVPAYDRSKARGSMLVDEAVRGGLNAVTVHPTAVIGPYDCGTSNQGLWLRRAAMGKEPVLVRGGFDWVDVRDVIRSAITAEDVTKAPAGEHFLLGGRRAEALEIATLASQAVGRRPPPIMLPLGFVRALVPVVDAVTGVLHIRTPFTAAALHALDTHRNISHAKAARMLAHTPRPLEDTVRDMMAWYREKGLLS